MITEIENSITIIYYDNDSYLHHSYIGYAIAALKDCLLSIAVQYVVNSIQTKYVVILFSFGWYPIFNKLAKTYQIFLIRT